MKPLPSLPDVGDATGLFESGHLWIQELVAGAPLRVRLESDGTLSFADRERPIDEASQSLRAAVSHLERDLDRSALLAAADDPSGVVLFGVATRYEGVPYDWDRLPPFLGTDVWSDTRDAYLPPDVVERTFERLGIAPVNAVQKEVDARHFDLAGYDLPDSAWYDGPAAGVVFRNKTGDRAVLRNAEARTDPGSFPDDPEDLAAAVVTGARVGRVTAGLTNPAFDGVFERTLAAVAREEHARLPPTVEDRAFRSAVAEQVRDHMP